MSIIRNLESCRCRGKTQKVSAGKGKSLIAGIKDASVNEREGKRREKDENTAEKGARSLNAAD